MIHSCGERRAIVASSPQRRSGHRYYSRFVFLMKILLSSLAIVLAGMVIAWPKLNSSNQQFPLSFASLSVSTNAVSSVMNARYHGTDKDNQPFSITAIIATESVPGRLNLSTPKADIALLEGRWLALEADSGQYQYDKALLDLEGEVNLFHDSGYQLHTRTAHIDLKGTTASGDSPVTGHGPFGALAGEGFHILDRGRTVLLTGQSRLLLDTWPVRSRIDDNPSLPTGARMTDERARYVVLEVPAPILARDRWALVKVRG